MDVLYIHRRHIAHLCHRYVRLVVVSYYVPENVQKIYMYKVKMDDSIPTNQLINNYSTPTRIFTFNYYLISNVSPYWLHQE